MLYIFSQDSDGFPLAISGSSLSKDPSLSKYLQPANKEALRNDDAYPIWHKLNPGDILITREGQFLVKEGQQEVLVEGIKTSVPTLFLELISSDPGFSYFDSDKEKWVYTSRPISNWISGD